MVVPARRRERSVLSYLIPMLAPMLLVALGAMLFVIGHWVWP